MPKREMLKSPVGTAGWCCINKPSTKFKPEGEYSVKLILPPDLANPLAEQFKAAAEAFKVEVMKEANDPKKAAIISKFNLHIPVSEHLAQDGTATGDFEISFKQTAVIKPKDPKKEPFPVKIGIFDAKGQPIPSEIMVGRGSRMKVAYEIVGFKNDATKQVGVTLRLKAVQVLELKQFGGERDAAGYGFGQEEGFTQEPSEGPQTTEGGEQPAAGKGDF